MSEEEDKNKDNENFDEGPGAAYQQFQIMEELLEKLKLLNYDEEYCRQLSQKPISRHYFTITTNSGEQFFAFASLSAWLLRTCGKKFEQPQEQDNPNAIISGIIDELRKMDHKPDFPSSRLKAGSGEQCLWVLNKLADESLKSRSFSWKKPAYPKEEIEENHLMEDQEEPDLNLLKDDDNVPLDDFEDDIEDEHAILVFDDLNPVPQDDSNNNNLGSIAFFGSSSQVLNPRPTNVSSTSTRPDVVMESSTDASEWKLEVERVLPQLKITIRPDNKDWRVHFDQMQHHQANISASLQESKAQLEKLSRDITKSLEKISSRENYISDQLSKKLQDFRVRQDQLTEVKEQYKRANVGVVERSKALTEITDDLERIKQDMEERGTAMADGTPLLKIKQSMAKLKEECQQMDIRIGVLQHILLRAKLKEKSLHALSANQQTIILDDDDENEFQGY